MQTNTISSSFNVSLLISRSSISNLLAIAEFLDFQTTKLILQNSGRSTKSENISTFLEIIFVKNFTEKYLHNADRSNYLMIYEQQKFKEIQNTKIKTLWLNGYQKFTQIDTRINDIKKGLTMELDGLFDVEQGLETLLMSLNDPMPPELNLRKTNIGTYCNSSFQFYLVEKRFPPKNKYLESPFAQLKQTLSSLKSAYYQEQNGQQKMKEENIKQKIIHLSEYWYKVNTENYECFLIQNQQGNNYPLKVHNTVVYLMALFDAMIEIVDLYLEVFSQDIFHEFIEFNVRFELFRNSLLQLQTQLNFLFEFYNEIVNQVQLSEPDKAQCRQLPANMTVWRCLLSKWYLYMKKRHNSLNVLYCFLFKKMNYSQFCQSLKQKQIELSHHIMSLENSLGIVEENIHGSIPLDIDSPLIDFAEDDQLVHQLLKEYVEYMVDISINEDSVHWCGHSDHQMHIPYQEYSNIVVDSLSQYLEKVYRICNQIDKSQSLFVQIINKIFGQMDKEYLKPITLKKLIKQVNSSWGHNVVLKQEDIGQTICDSGSLTAEHPNIVKTVRFSQRDQRVEHFNLLERIPSKFNYSCNIVIQSQDFNSSLKVSGNTHCTESEKNLEELEFFGGINKAVSINCEL